MYSQNRERLSPLGSSEIESRVSHVCGVNKRVNEVVVFAVRERHHLGLQLADSWTALEVEHFSCLIPSR